MALSEQRKKELDKMMAEQGVTPVGTPNRERKNVLGQIASDFARPFARIGSSTLNLLQSSSTLGAAGIAALTGDKDQANRLVRQAGDEARRVRTLPGVGELDVIDNPKDSIAVGLQVGSTLAGGGATGSAVKQGLRTAIKQGAKEGLKIGASTGALYEGGRAIEEDKNALQVLGSVITGGAIGGAFGGVLGGAVPLATRGAATAFRTARELGVDAIESAGRLRTRLVGTEAEPGIAQQAGNVVKGIGENVRSTVNKLQGAGERSKINAEAQQQAREAFEQLSPQSQDAIRGGLLPRDVELIISGNPQETQVYKKILEAAEAYETNRASNIRPSAVVGQEYRKRLTGLQDAFSQATSKLDDAVAQARQATLDAGETMGTVLERLQRTTGLQGLTIKNGSLDFSQTTLSGANSKAARAEIQKIFNDVMERASDPQRLHLFRQELFEDLGGKRPAGIKLTATQERAVNAMRQGMADAIDRVASGYKAANEEVSRLFSLQRDVRRTFGEVAKGNEDIFDLKSSILLRRLTSNAKTGQDMAALLRDVEGELAQYGINFDTSLLRLQEFLNVLDRYYDIAPDTSLLGITRTAVPTNSRDILNKIINVVGENISATDETAKAAIRKLLGR